MEVKIDFTNITDRITIYATDKPYQNISINGEKSLFDFSKFLFYLGNMIKSWPNKLIDNNIVDGASYSIVIKTNTEKRKYYFQNKFPENINNLDKLIGEIKNATTNL